MNFFNKQTYIKIKNFLLNNKKNNIFTLTLSNKNIIFRQCGSFKFQYDINFFFLFLVLFFSNLIIMTTSF
jgi:hypothetical protein